MSSPKYMYIHANIYMFVHSNVKTPRMRETHHQTAKQLSVVASCFEDEIMFYDKPLVDFNRLPRSCLIATADRHTLYASWLNRVLATFYGFVNNSNAKLLPQQKNQANFNVHFSTCIYIHTHILGFRRLRSFGDCAAFICWPTSFPPWFIYVYLTVSTFKATSSEERAGASAATLDSPLQRLLIDWCVSDCVWVCVIVCDCVCVSMREWHRNWLQPKWAGGRKWLF